MPGFSKNLIDAINLTPAFNVILWIGVAGLFLFIVFWAGFFLLHVLGAPFRFFSGSTDEFDGIVVFWGSVAVIATAVWAAFHFGILAFD